MITISELTSTNITNYGSECNW